MLFGRAIGGSEHKYKTAMLVMNKLTNMLQGKNPQCLAQLEYSTAVQAPAAREVPSAEALRTSRAIVASRMGDVVERSVKVLVATANEEVSEPPLKKKKVMTCTICKQMGDDMTTHGRKSDMNCPNRDVKPETVSTPVTITAEMCSNGRVCLPDCFWPCTKFSSEAFTIPEEAQVGERWVAVMPRKKLHKESQIPKEFKKYWLR